MSLFKAREWWSTSCGQEEGFDQASLCVSGLGNSGNEMSMIIIGSHAGTVRVFCPNLPPASEAPSYKPSDLLIEMNLPHPVLQLHVGRFISGSQQFHLAVLHPRSVAIYSLVIRGGNTEHGEQSALVFVYEHQLRRSAYSLVVGPFGGVRGRDFLCVQALDGTLSFYEQESFVFTRQLPNFLLPGPLIFIPSTDAFLTCNSHLHIESYRYQVLADTSEDNSKQLIPDWSLNIGESALDIACVAHSTSEVDIIVLGEHNLFCLRDHGTLKFMCRFEFHPRCFFPYLTVPEGLLMVLIATDTGTLLVQNNTTLRWSAQLPISPVAISRASLQGMDGVIVLLSETGELQCCYLGTEPSLFVAPSIEPKPIDYQEAEKELNYLGTVIRAFNDSSSVLLANTAAERELSISVKPSQHPESRGESEVCFVAVNLSPHSAHAPLTKVQVTVVTRSPLVAEPPSHSIASLSEGYQVASYITVKGAASEFVCSLEVSVIVSYITASGIPRILTSNCQLPLRLVAHPCNPAKEAEIKITLNTSTPEMSLTEIFPEFNSANGGPNILGFLVGSKVVTVIAAKTSTRYRLQSDSILPLALLVKHLIFRLERILKSVEPKASIKVTSSSPLPLDHLFSAIDSHLTCRKHVADLKEELGQLSVQFRAIERRLLTKMKDKKPAPLNQLDTLLNATQVEIISASHRLEQTLQDLENSQWVLGCAVELIHVLLQLSENPSKYTKTFYFAMSPEVIDSDEQGWEDITYASLKHILNTNKKQDPLTLSSSNDPVIDITNMKKIITSVLDVISKSYSTSGIDIEARKPISPIHESEEAEEEPTVPIGSRLAENRGLSAKATHQNKLLPGRLNASAGLMPDTSHIEGNLSKLAVSSPTQNNSEDDILWI
ncbi:Protein PTHB1 [Frankliniella fusca]|uniref:Protein PTHB1 n=1 Tax=Frankliniella fusca TaxID=407009 RepID=A0AAE1LS57_9NEOP|nr:Protein PTHB1 [Frankliniella fusca]